MKKYYCPVCGYETDDEIDVCPICFAQMEKREDEEVSEEKANA